jgi:hypothetical protein
MARLVFDIETVGEDWKGLDETTQEVLTRYVDNDDEDAVEEVKNGLGLSPLTGQIVAIGILDQDRNEGAVYYQAPGQPAAELVENGITFRSMSEPEMLKAFWKTAANYDEFISYNGRAFDAPFLAIRSAIHKIRPTRDLLEGRYLYQQRTARHVDLQDQMTFYGAMQKKGGLHLHARAFGIQSPKIGGVSGGDVGEMFKKKRYLEIAKYNVGDLKATRELYEYWDKYLRG